MTPAVLALCAASALIAAAFLLRSIGPGFRIGRLLSGTTTVPIDDAIALASSGEQRYVRVTGRITSDEEFPDDQHRPLVFRRTRLEVATGSPPESARDWRVVLDEREAVPFAVETRSSAIAVDDAALDEGLVVIPRESVGRVADLPSDLATDLPAGTQPDQPARLRIEQLSAVEHATVCGVPGLRDGAPVLTSGLGRPLIVTTLDQAAAMRVLAGGGRGRVAVATALLVAGVGLLAAAVLALVVGA